MESQFNFKIDEKNALKHDFLVFCNDVLVSILKYADKYRLGSFSFCLLPEDRDNLENVISKDPYGWEDWLMTNGYENTVYELYYRDIFFSLLTDFTHFFYESIHCAAKMKMAPAFSLIRKPLKDNLAYLEWLYLDRKAVVDGLLFGTANDLLLNKVKIKELSDELRNRGKNDWFDLRYNSEKVFSLENRWNKAMHIITNRKKMYMTQPGELNFIFVDHASLSQYSDYYYKAVIPAIFFTVELVTEMFENIIQPDDFTSEINSLNRLLKNYLNFIPVDGDQASCEAAIKDVLTDLKNLDLTFSKIPCPYCFFDIETTAEVIAVLTFDDLFCPSCGKKINTFIYMLGWEDESKIQKRYIDPNIKDKLDPEALNEIDTISFT